MSSAMVSAISRPPMLATHVSARHTNACTCHEGVRLSAKTDARQLPIAADQQTLATSILGPWIQAHMPHYG